MTITTNQNRKFSSLNQFYIYAAGGIPHEIIMSALSYSNECFNAPYLCKHVRSRHVIVVSTNHVLITKYHKNSPQDQALRAFLNKTFQ